nr:MAG TPA: hypothetical protein [Caudoviricetes sp.]
MWLRISYTLSNIWKIKDKGTQGKPTFLMKRQEIPYPVRQTGKGGSSPPRGT